jgi:cytochrome c2
MIPSRFTQAACLDCHRNRLTVPGAPVLNRGRELFYEYGCHGCHALKYTDNMPVTGPTLRGINRKLTREWARTFIDSPQKVKPETRMPEFFHLSNSPEKTIEAIEIEAILEYLYNDSMKLESTVSRMPRGNMQRGKVLFDSIGCLGCHSLDTGIVPPAVNHRGIDKKLQRQWVMSWLKNPSAYNPKTLMPGLRLTKSEIADISAFLKGQDLAGHGFTMLAAPKWESRVDKLLKQRMEPAPSRVTRRLLQKLLPRQKLHRLGQKTILFYGCYGCHEIRNMDNMNPVGSILDNEGSKNLSDLDFGGHMGKIPHERYAYFEQILKDPRLFDVGQKKETKDRLRMPKYLLGEAYQDALTCFLLGEKQNHAAASIRIKETQEDLAYKKGEYLMMEWKCYGCHILYRHNESRRGSIRYYITDSTMAPPFLYLEGKKVEPNWLFSFLDSVQTVRPWLKVRMPSFDFSRDTLDILVKHFEAEAGTPTIETYFDPARVSRRNINFGKKLFVQFKCETCHIKRGRAPRQRPRDQWAPDIALTPKRMRVEWIVKWLKDPQTYVPGTRMPNYFYDYDEDEKVFEPLIPNPGESILAMRDYLYTAYR